MRKGIVKILLSIMIFSIFTPILEIQARGNTGLKERIEKLKEKKIDLRKKFSGKKLEKLKKSVKTAKNYRFIIESDEDIEEVKKYYK